MGGGAIDLDAVIDTVPRVGEVGIRADVVVQQFDIDGWDAIAVVGDKNTDFRRQSCRTSRNMRVRDRDIAGAGWLVRLNQKGGVTVLPSRRCPPTFSSMMYVPGQRPPPPGDDPYHIRVKTRKAISVARFLFDVDVAHGTGGAQYQCGAERRTTGWRAQCIVVSSWSS